MKRAGTLLALLCTAILAAAGCAAEEPAADPGAIEPESFDEPTPVVQDAEMPPECAAVSVGWLPGVDVHSLENLPADWPAPPQGATLCSTMHGSSIETAAYASPDGIDDVFAYYEAALPTGYESSRMSGEENGTGYESLDGNGPGVAFQVRRNDGGFTLAFANEAS